MLGLHLGMSGRILVTDPTGALTEGGDRLAGAGTAAEQADRNPGWSRFTITFADGGTCACSTNGAWPGPARSRSHHPRTRRERISAAAFRDRVGRGTAPVKARLLDQSVLAGVGNLLADETLWQARLDPGAGSTRSTTTSSGRCTGPCGRRPGPPSATVACTPAP